MAGRTIGEEVTKELAVKATIWGPALAGGVVAGPVGAAVGAVLGIAAILFGGSVSAPPSGGDPPKE
jgi:hypothetical protein